MAKNKGKLNNITNAAHGNQASTAHGLQMKDVKLPMAVFMVFSLCAGGAYGIEEIISKAGSGLTLVCAVAKCFLGKPNMDQARHLS